MIAKRRIYFGHQSVGSDIIEGVRTHFPQQFHIIHSRNLALQSGDCLYHCAIGRNREPESKIEDFSGLLKSEFGNNVDIAGFKFCYVDILTSTDVKALFDSYKTAMDFLTQTFKHTTFVHFTVPLTTVESRLKHCVQRLSGKIPRLLSDNQNRQLYNETLIRYYGNKAFIFDLAGLESTSPSGTKCVRSLGNNRIPFLSPEYTNDGGHLNHRGKEFVAAEFLKLIGKVLSHSSSPIQYTVTA